MDADGPSNGFSTSGWNENLPSDFNAHSPCDLLPQLLTSIVAKNAKRWNITKRDTIHVSFFLICLDFELKKDTRLSGKKSSSTTSFDENGKENRGGKISICDSDLVEDSAIVGESEFLCVEWWSLRERGLNFKFCEVDDWRENWQLMTAVGSIELVEPNLLRKGLIYRPM